MKRAAGVGLLAVAVAAGVVSGATLAHEHAAVTSYSGPPLPARFTAADGAAYRQLAVTSLSNPAQKSATLTVHVGSDPVDVMGACDRPVAYAYMFVKVNGTFSGLIKCQQTPQPIALPVRAGRTAVVTFVPAGGPYFRSVRADWQLAAYTWTPPATIRPAPAAPRLPRSYTGPNTTAGYGNSLMKLVASRSGTWPTDHTATFTLTYHGDHHLAIVAICAGTIGGRLQVNHGIDGSRADVGNPCTPAGPDDLGTDVGDLSGVDGQPMTLTFHIQAPSRDFAAAYAKRAVSWTIAIYEAQ